MYLLKHLCQIWKLSIHPKKRLQAERAFADAAILASFHYLPAEHNRMPG